MPADPHDVLQRGLAYLLAKDMAGFIGLYAQDATMEFPFAPPGRPCRLHGRAEVHDYLIDYPQVLDLHGIANTTVHRTDDPEVIIAEFTAEGRVVATGKPYVAQYIAVLTVRNGQIAHYRDYWNPSTFADTTFGSVSV